MAPNTSSNTNIIVALFCTNQRFNPSSIQVACSPNTRKSTTGAATDVLAITTNNTNAITLWTLLNVLCAMSSAAATVSIRFFGFKAENRNANPSALIGVNESKERSHFGKVGSWPGFGRCHTIVVVFKGDNQYGWASFAGTFLIFS